MSGTKLNAIALYANFVVMALLGLAINPLLVQSLGATDFGIWKSLLRLLDLSGVADGRATQALKWIIAHGSKRDDELNLRRAIAAAILMWLFWLPVLLFAVSAVVYFLPSLITGITADHLTIARGAALVLGINVILSAVVGIPDAVLFGTNQGYRSIILTTAFLILSNGLMLVVARAGYGLTALGLVTLGSTVLNGTFTWWVARRRVKWWGIAKPKRSDVTRFAGFSNWTLVWALVQLLLLSSELLLISALSGPVAVTKYTFTSYSIQFALSICLMTGSAVTPRLGALIGSGDLNAAGRLVGQTREILLTVMTVSGACILLLNKTFVSTWIGPQYYMGDTLNALMVIAFLQLAHIRLEAQVQDVGLNISKKVLVALAATLASLLLAGLLYIAFGSLESIYLGLIIGRFLASILLPRLVSGLVPISPYYWRGIAVLSTAVGGAILAAPFINPHGWLALLLTAAAAFIVLAGIALVLVVSPETRSLVYGRTFAVRERMMQ
ncbi:O-antigen/teichoic acid export membrane protein [Bradyrhizobium sp. i1.15.2]|uniref:lipopolysaccharide biosynthesis protein n=1 Tax=Bradyrhizobium sp. i1.15.2 TaxID=3156362 RepID=UPI0033971491